MIRRYLAIVIILTLTLVSACATSGNTTFSRQDAELQMAVTKAAAEEAANKATAEKQALSAQADEACKAAYMAALRGDEKSSAQWAERCRWLYCMSQTDTVYCGPEVAAPIFSNSAP